MRCERKQSGNELDGIQKRSFNFRGNSTSCRWGNLHPNIKHSRDTGIAAVGIAVVGIAACTRPMDLSVGQSARVNKTQTVRRTIREIKHVE